MNAEHAGAIGAIAKGVAEGLHSFSTHSARAAASANAVSAGAQSAAANFNQTSANNANSINNSTIANQYGFNSGQAAIANQFTQSSWDQAAAWNEEMFERQMEFNHNEAKLNRQWQEKMDSTKYQRAMADMKAGGLNPVLAAGGISVSGGGGGAASVSSPTMGAMSGHAGSGGLLGANDASISGYNGQMEYMGGVLGLMSAALGGISSAVQAMSQLGLGYDNSRNKYGIADFVYDILQGDTRQLSNPNTKFNQFSNKIDNFKKSIDSGYYNPTMYRNGHRKD